MLAAKGQTPADTIITIDIIPHLGQRPILHPDKEYKLILYCQPMYDKRVPSAPVDMMVRHYFGISYWD